MSYLDQAKDLYQQIYSGNLLEAFEKYYAEDVVMVEGSGEVCEGKQANRKREEEFVGAVEEIHDGGIKGLTSNEDEGITMVESWMDVSFKDGNRKKLEQVAVQKWHGEQIIHERFYYNAG